MHVYSPEFLSKLSTICFYLFTDWASFINKYNIHLVLLWLFCPCSCSNTRLGPIFTEISTLILLMSIYTSKPRITTIYQFPLWLITVCPFQLCWQVFAHLGPVGNCTPILAFINNCMSISVPLAIVWLSQPMFMFKYPPLPFCISKYE